MAVVAPLMTARRPSVPRLVITTPETSHLRISGYVWSSLSPLFRHRSCDLNVPFGGMLPGDDRRNGKSTWGLAHRELRGPQSDVPDPVQSPVFLLEPGRRGMTPEIEKQETEHEKLVRLSRSLTGPRDGDFCDDLGLRSDESRAKVVQCWRLSTCETGALEGECCQQWLERMRPLSREQRDHLTCQRAREDVRAMVREN